MRTLIFLIKNSDKPMYERLHDYTLSYVFLLLAITWILWFLHMVEAL